MRKNGPYLNGRGGIKGGGPPILGGIWPFGGLTDIGKGGRAKPGGGAPYIGGGAE